MNDQQVIFSMVRVGRVFPPNRQVLRDISLGFFYGAWAEASVHINHLLTLYNGRLNWLSGVFCQQVYQARAVGIHTAIRFG